MILSASEGMKTCFGIFKAYLNEMCLFEKRKKERKSFGALAPQSVRLKLKNAKRGMPLKC